MPRKPSRDFLCVPFPSGPFKIKFCTLGGNFSNGVFRSNPWAAAASCNRCWRFPDAEPGPRPPSSRGFDQSTITLPGSKSYLLPKPLHSLQAPYIELKENDRGSSCGTLIPHSGHANVAE